MTKWVTFSTHCQNAWLFPDARLPGCVTQLGNLKQRTYISDISLRKTLAPRPPTPNDHYFVDLQV